MLHILLLILKIIGIALAVVIGLILLILLTVLFVPVRYYGYGSKSGDNLEAEAKVTWLFKAVSVAFGYAGNEMYQRIRIFGIDVQKVASFFEKRRQKKERKNPGKRKRREAVTAAPRETLEGPAESKKPEKPVTETEKQTAQPCLEEREPVKTDTPLLLEEAEEPDTAIGRFFQMLGRLCRKIAGWIRSAFGAVLRFIRNIWAIPEKILGFFKKIGLTIQSVCAKISYWKEFLEDERTRGAIRMARTSLAKILKHMAPKKVKGEVTFGFEDPCATGQLLAGICAFYPVYQDHIRLNPAFDRAILEGSIKLRGRIYVFLFVRIAWAVYRNQDIRYVIKTFQHKEEA